MGIPCVLTRSLRTRKLDGGANYEAVHNAKLA